MLMQLNHWLIERYRNGGLCTIVIDEAQNLTWELLEEVRLLTNLETATDKLVQVVLSGQPELEVKLRDPRVRQLRQRIALWSKTRPLSREETGSYISLRLQIAGSQRPILSPEAVEAVYRSSQGVPRVINLVCEHAMINAYVEQVKPIPARIVELVATELELGQQPFLVTSAVIPSSSQISSHPSGSKAITPITEHIPSLKEAEI